jgi:hypothetical protein
MAHTIPSCGDNYHRNFNTFVKVPIAGYLSTPPLVGDLVILDTTINNGVDLCADEELPYGIVESVNSANGFVSVTEFISGCQIELPYSGSLSLGDNIEVGSEAGAQDTVINRSIVQRENSGGIGVVIAVDAGAPHGTGFAVVRWS